MSFLSGGFDCLQGIGHKMVNANVQLVLFFSSVQPNLALNSGSQLVAAPHPKSELDEMFSNLGLDDFAAGNNSTIQPLPRSNTSGSITSLTSSGSTNSLSIQDKQR